MFTRLRSLVSRIPNVRNGHNLSFHYNNLRIAPQLGGMPTEKLVPISDETYNKLSRYIVKKTDNVLLNDNNKYFLTKLMLCGDHNPTNIEPDILQRAMEYVELDIVTYYETRD